MRTDHSLQTAIGCVIGVAVLASASLAAAPPKAKPGKVEVPNELAHFHHRLLHIQSELRVPGIALAVVKNDKVVYTDAVGERDTQKHLPMTPDTISYIASITKTYVGTAIILLFNDGKIDLNAPVKKYLPRFKLADPKATESITIRDLLTHAKGINSKEIVWLDAFTGQINDDRYYHWLAEVVPKGSHEYTNVHFTLLGRVIEAVTGQTWQEYLQERLFTPTGMTRTTCYASRMYGDANCAIPSIRSGDGFKPAPVRKIDSVMHAAGGIGSSVNDMARWIRLHLNGGSIDGTTIFPKKLADQMQALQVKADSPLPSWLPHQREGHGFAWAVGNFRGHRLLDHGGGYTGASATISFLPKEKIGVAVVANVSGPIPELVSLEIYDRLLGTSGPDLLPRFKQMVDRSVKREEKKKKNQKPMPNIAETGSLSLPAQVYAGDYENEDWGVIQIRYENGKIVGTQGNLTLSFESSGKDQFIMSYGTGEPDKGTFVIDHGYVTAIIMTIYNKPWRFERTH